LQGAIEHRREPHAGARELQRDRLRRVLDIGGRKPVIASPLRIGAQPPDEFHVPVVMQAARALSPRGHAPGVAPRVMIVDRVQRLMQIPDQVQQELQGAQFLGRAGPKRT